MFQQFMSKLSDKEKMMLYVTIAIVLLASLDRLLIDPGFTKLKNSKEEISKQERIIKTDLRVLEEKDNINARSEIFSRYFTEKLEPNDVVNRGFLSSIEKLASQSKVTITKSNPTDVKKQKRQTEYYANLSCTGELENIITFMHAVNSSEDLLKIVKFDLLPKKGSETNEVNASMSIVKMVMSQDLAHE